MQYKVFIHLFIVLSIIYGCTQKAHERVVISVEDEDAEQYSEERIEELSPSLADGLEISMWASEELVRDPVALDVDYEGRVFISATERRRNSEIDIRGHRDWMIESVGFETVEDRRDFLHRELARKRSTENTWLEDHNQDGFPDWRDLTVNKESIFILEDQTRNGYANLSRQFIRDFHDEVTDVAGAVLTHQGDVFLGVAPDMWRINDADGDGYADKKESISHGYGVNIGFGGHGMSGLTVGPDGRIYWAIGDRGISIEDKEGKKWHHPREGVIVRSEPDGSNFEVYATGFRNPHEFVFDKYGNLITVDHDGGHAGEFERLIYVINGGDSGWRLNWQFGKYNDPKNNDYKVLMEEEYYKPRFDNQAAHLLPTISRYHDGPVGMAYNPGTALNEQWNDHFFVAEFVGSATRSGIHSFTLKPSGASFELEKDELVMDGLLATGIDFGPDGALYFADWIEGWDLKQQGRIWKLDVLSDTRSPIRRKTKDLLAEDFTSQPAKDLLELLGHDDMRVRKKAQFELARRDDVETFQTATEQTAHQLKRIHGIWGLAQIGRRIPEVVEPLTPLLKDKEAEIRAQTAKMLGDVRYEPAAGALIPLLEDENARVRLFATEALGRLAWQPALEPIVEMLEANEDEDVYLRHVGAIALERIGDGEAIAALSDHHSRAVRIAAVVALKRLEHPGVVRFLKDQDEFVVTNTARAINDDAFIEEGLEDLSEMTEQDRFVNEPLLRRAINANLYLGTPAAAQRLAEFAARENMPEPLRIEALNTLSVWPESSKLDRVTGDPRGKVENKPEDAREAIASVLDEILDGKNRALKIAGMQTASNLTYEPALGTILQLLAEDRSAEVRVAALHALVDMEYEGIEEAVLSALEDENEGVRMSALHSITDVNLSDEKTVEFLRSVLEDGTIQERQTAISLLGDMDDDVSRKLLGRQLERLISGELDRQVELELIQAAENVESETINKRLQAYFTENSEQDSVSIYSASLHGGDPEEGRRLFYQNETAQCVHCHAVDGEGSEVGPDLSSIGSELTREELLEALVAPNARIAPGYGSVTLTMDDGETVSGILQKENSDELIVASGDEEWIISKSSVRERNHSASGMPAMGEVLSRDELRDLVEFLKSLVDSEL